MEAAGSPGRLGNHESVGPLNKALQYPDAHVRANACMALGRSGGERALSCRKDAETGSGSFRSGCR